MNSENHPSSNKKRVSLSVIIYPWIVCLIGAAFYFYEYYLRIAPSVMAPQLMNSYHISARGFGNLAAFYYYAYTPMQFLVGMLFDRFGVRKLLALACLLCAVGTYLFAFSNFLYVADVGRFLIGFGSAFAFVGALKLAAVWLPPERFGMIAGLVTSLGMLGAILGDVSLTALVEFEGWRTATMMMAIFGLILTVILFVSIRDGNKSESKVRAQHATDPVEFPELFYSLGQALKNPQIWVIGLIGCCLFLSVTAFAELWAVPYLSSVHSFGPERAATIGSVIFMGWVVGGPLSGFLSDFLQRRKIVIAVGAICGSVFISLVLMMPHMRQTWLIVCLFFYGLFCGVQVLTFAVAREVASRRISGTAVSLNNMLVMLGGVLFQPLIGAILDWHWTGEMLNGVRHYSISDYTTALLILPLSLIVSFILALFLKETHCKLQDH